MSNEKQREPKVGDKRKSAPHLGPCRICGGENICADDLAFAKSAAPAQPQTIGENDPPPDPKGNWMGAPAAPSPVLTPDSPDTEHGMSSEELAGQFEKYFKPAAPEAVLTQPSAEQLKHAIKVIMSTTEPMCRRSPDVCQGLPDKPSCPECAEREAVLRAIGYSGADEKWSEAERPVLPVPDLKAEWMAQDKILDYTNWLQSELLKARASAPAVPNEFTHFLETVAWNKGCSREYLAELALKLMRAPAVAATLIAFYSAQVRAEVLAVKAWDADSGSYEDVSGYIYDPNTKTVELQTDDNS